MTDATLDAVLAILEENIENKLNTYQQLVAAWRCDIVTDFAGLAFFDNPTTPLLASYTVVISDVNSKVLVPLCLNRPDFERFVDFDFFNNSGILPPSNASFNQIRAGVARYTTAAFTHYFPDANESGVAPSDW
eukprot:CAMPEP_0116571864 /NCGR_PEP_ID=MMETSP0397-20121206/17827_1 /TAXON_ID=216820 /ORGANISM="Cyclophora tenuis, Strain ECT3854" /LENGTH=132 /DNA_ID=CAMNT_0004100069 /DNA_START=37 /DNA_END=432 /DNA_ORIENTATION=-